MWRILRIDENDYGCEERTEDEALLCLVTVVNEAGDTHCFTAEDDFLTGNNLNEGDAWPENAPPGRAPFPLCKTDIGGERA